MLRTGGLRGQSYARLRRAFASPAVIAGLPKAAAEQRRRRLQSSPAGHALLGVPTVTSQWAGPRTENRLYSQGRYGRYIEQQQQHHQYGEPEWEYRPEGPSGGKVLFLRPTLWAAAFTAGTFYLCSSMFVDHREKLRQRSQGILGILWPGSSGVDEDDRIWALMSDTSVQHLVGRSHRVSGESHAKMIRRIAHLPGWVPFELKRSAVAFADHWYQLSRGKRCVYTIAGINAVVFGMWQLPRLLPFMARRFMHDPRSGLSYTMLTSTFSHREFWHLLFNTIGLVSFGAPVANAMGIEQFTAFYLSTGVMSSLISHLLAPLRPALILPSLGASGAVYGVVGATMMLYPDSKIALIFLPFLPVTISQAFPALLAYDLAGAVLGWGTFNHIAHLAGGLCGIGYLQWGAEQWAVLVQTIERHRRRKE